MNQRDGDLRLPPVGHPGHSDQGPGNWIADYFVAHADERISASLLLSGTVRAAQLRAIGYASDEIAASMLATDHALGCERPKPSAIPRNTTQERAMARSAASPADLQSTTTLVADRQPLEHGRTEL